MVLFLLNANLSVGIAGGLSMNNKVFVKVDNKWKAIEGLVDARAAVIVAEAKLAAFEAVKANYDREDGREHFTEQARAEHDRLNTLVNEAGLGKQTFFGCKSIVAEGNVSYKFHMGSLFIKPEGVIGMNFANKQKGVEGVVSSSYYGQVNVKPGYSMGTLDVYGIVGFRMTQSNVVLGDSHFQDQTNLAKGYVFSGMPMTLALGGGVSYAVASNVAVKVDATYGMGFTSKELSKQVYDNNKALQASVEKETTTIALGGDVRVVGGVNYSF